MIMGPEGNNEGLVLYFGDTRVGELTKFDSIPTIEPSEPLTFGEQPSSSIELKFTASAWQSCRTRKRFVKLVGGVFGLPRNQAVALARAAMESGCPSYADLWADCFSYFITETLKYMATHDKEAEG